MTTFYDEAALFMAWPTGVALAGERYFGDGTHSPPPPRASGTSNPESSPLTKGSVSCRPGSRVSGCTGQLL